jgi:hypothetical protein
LEAARFSFSPARRQRSLLHARDEFSSRSDRDLMNDRVDISTGLL